LSVDFVTAVACQETGSIWAPLRQVLGRVQMTLRSVSPEHARAPTRATPDLGSGRAYLQSRAAEARRSGDVPAVAPVLAAGRRRARGGGRAERVGRSGRVASVYHLIPRSCVDAYVSAAQRAAQGAEVRMVLTGPFPAYAFGGP